MNMIAQHHADSLFLRAAHGRFFLQAWLQREIPGPPEALKTARWGLNFFLSQWEIAPSSATHCDLPNMTVVTRGQSAM